MTNSEEKEHWDLKNYNKVEEHYSYRTLRLREAKIIKYWGYQTLSLKSADSEAVKNLGYRTPRLKSMTFKDMWQWRTLRFK